MREFTIGLGIGIFLTSMFFMSISTSHVNLIDRGFAHYDAKSGDFTLKEAYEPIKGN